MKNNLGAILVILSTILVFSTLFYFGSIEFIIVRISIAIVLTISSYIVFLTGNKMSKRNIAKILSPYWIEYLRSNYAFERKLQLDQFIKKHTKNRRNPYYFYVTKKVTMSFWNLSRLCAESKGYVPGDDWEKYLNDYLKTNLGFPEREIRLLVAFEISKFVEIDE